MCVPATASAITVDDPAAHWAPVNANTALPSSSRVAIAVGPVDVPWFEVHVTPPRQLPKSWLESMSTVVPA